MNKNDIIRLEITDANTDGMGVCRAENGMAVFVAGGFIGDTVDARIIKVKKDYLVARIEQLLVPSPYRIAPDCEAFGSHCGGCQFRHITYEAERQIKLKHVLSCLRGIDCDKPSEVLFASVDGYRNKAAYPVDKNLNFGCYSARSHRIVTHKSCALESPVFSEIAAFLCEECRRYGISGYDEQSGKGILRHIIMRSNRLGQVLLMPVINCKRLPHEREIASAITERFKCVVGICVNINTKNTNVITGDNTYYLCGEKHLRETLLGRPLLISARSFFQVNTDGCERLYSLAANMLESGEGRILLDLYCGIGSIGLCLAEKGDKLCGVEIIPEAVEDARRNAKLCGRSDADTYFVCGDAATGVKECTEKFGKPDAVIVDPPRKGLSAEVISAVIAASPKQLIYISCCPATLGRDLKILTQNGYKATKVQCVDMFPRTGHVETVCLLSKLAAKQHIDINLDTDEPDLTDA